MVLEFPNARHPRKASAVATFRIILRGRKGGQCAPCSVFLDVFPGALPGYSMEEYVAFQEEFMTAMSRAHPRVTARLAANTVRR